VAFDLLTACILEPRSADRNGLGRGFAAGISGGRCQEEARTIDIEGDEDRHRRMTISVEPVE
jgi:hypothetical protein